MKHCKSLLKDDPAASPLFAKGDRKTGVSRAVYDLIAHGIRGQIKKESVLSMLGELVNLHSDIPSILLDIFGILDAETAGGGGTAGGGSGGTAGGGGSSNGGGSGEGSSEERIVFCYIVKESERFLSEKLLKERLEIDTLQDVGTIKNRSFYTKFIKVKTKL